MKQRMRVSRGTRRGAWVAAAVLVLVAGCAKPSLPRYQVTDLGTLGGDESEAVDVNDAGQVAGSARTVVGQWNACRWDNGTFENLGREPDERLQSFATSINRYGWVSGWVARTPGTIRMIWPTRTPRRVFPQGLVLPPRRGQGEDRASAVNDAGDVVGWTLYPGSSPAGQAQERVVSFRVSGLALPFFIGYEEHQAFDINNEGAVAGRVRLKTGPWAGAFRACVWREGDVTVLGSLGGRSSVAYRISESGVAVGEAENRLGESVAAVWESGRVRGLGTLGGRRSAALDLNAHGDVVGWAETDNGARHAFLRRNSRMIDLNRCTALPANWLLAEARGVNDRGWIVGAALVSGKRRAFLLTPGDGSPVFAPGSASTSPAADLVPPAEPDTPAPFEIVELDTLGGDETLPRSINDLGEVVGSSQDAAGVRRPFHWEAGVMTDLSTDSTAESGEATAINGWGAITGTLVFAKRETCVLWEPGNNMSVPVYRGNPRELTRGQAIGDSGQIAVMVARVPDWTSARAFLRDSAGGGISLDPPDSTAWVMGLNNNHLSVGRFTDESGHSRPFLAEGAQLRPIGDLDGRTGTAAAINSADHFVGQASDDNQTMRAFLSIKNRVTWLGTLGGRESAAEALNDADDVVGWAETDNGTRHAFLWRRGRLTDLNSAFGPSNGRALNDAVGINARGWIIATGTTGGKPRGFLLAPPGEMRRLADEHPPILRWRPPLQMESVQEPIAPVAVPAATRQTSATRYAVIDLGTAGAAGSHAAALSNRDQVVGWLECRGRTEEGFLWQNGVMTRLDLPWTAFAVRAVEVSDDGLVFGTVRRDASSRVQALVWKCGTPVEVPTLGGDQSEVAGVSRTGRIVGSSLRPDNTWNPFIWERGTLTRLKVFSQGPGWAQAVSRSGRVAGIADYSAGAQRLFLWDEGHVTDLGRLIYAKPTVTGVNDRGQLVGVGTDRSGVTRGWVLDGTRACRIDTFGGSNSRANAIANDGRIVGWAEDAKGMRRAMLWENGTLTDLNSCIDTGKLWFLTDAVDINDRGHIAGTGILGEEVHAFLLVPRGNAGNALFVIPPAFAAAAVLAVAVGRAMRKKRRAGVIPR